MSDERAPEALEDDDLQAEGDFADEHEQTWTGSDDGESESPEGHGGLEDTSRPN
jgi:hypothetical protein